MHSFNGTMPYQQLPPQLIWSQRRTPPMLRFCSGEADVDVIVVDIVRRKARVVAKRGSIVDDG